MRHPQEPGPADIRVNEDRRKQTAEVDHVVEVVDVVRIPVVLAARTEKTVLDANLLVLLPGPAQFLINIAGRYQGAIGVIHFFSVQWNDA